MINGKWIDRFRVVLLSAIGGLFSSAVYLMVYRVEEYLADLAYREELAREALSPSGFLFVASISQIRSGGSTHRFGTYCFSLLLEFWCIDIWQRECPHSWSSGF